MNTALAFFTANSDLVNLVFILNEKIPKKGSWRMKPDVYPLTIAPSKVEGVWGSFVSKNIAGRGKRPHNY